VIGGVRLSPVGDSRAQPTRLLNGKVTKLMVGTGAQITDSLKRSKEAGRRCP
jgi:hypothetical protein